MEEDYLWDFSKVEKVFPVVGILESFYMPHCCRNLQRYRYKGSLKILEVPYWKCTFINPIKAINRHTRFF